jgi:transcriptional regulator NrdR family protein
MPEPVEQTPCPICGCPCSRVVDVRRRVDVAGVVHSWRVRVCTAGRHRYSTKGREWVTARKSSTCSSPLPSDPPYPAK